MDYKHIENLVLLCKADNEEAKEALVSEFTPFIINLCKKSFISGYEFVDIKNECYKALFNCIKLYKPEKHRFVAYATNAIKNSVNCLIRKSVRRNVTESSKTLILDRKLENMYFCDMSFVEEDIYRAELICKIRHIINKLNMDEKKFIDYIFFKGYSMKKYSQFTKTPYFKVFEMKVNVLNKLKDLLYLDNYSFE